MANILIGISLISVILYVYGLFDFFFNVEDNRCEMTYMYEVPQYIEIPMEDNVRREFPRYGLYVYGEGKYADALAAGKFDGSAVLFIPGNGGSYKQVRSLASVAYRSWLDYEENIERRRARRPLNVFSVDLDEDLAAVSGHLLRRQTAFVAQCVAVVRALYSSQSRRNNASSQLIIVAHSMGGVVARAIFAEPGFDAASVRVIFTLAAPTLTPHVFVDRLMWQYYNRVEDHWRRHGNTSLHHVSVVCVSGGERDVQVRPHQARGHDRSTLVTSTECVPGLWLSADHQCIVWCRQLIVTLVRAIFQLVHVVENGLTHSWCSHDISGIACVLRHHFVQKWHGKYLRMPRDSSSPKLYSDAKWLFFNSTSPWSHTADRVTEPTYLALDLFAAHLSDTVHVSTVGRLAADWLLLCALTSRQCSRVENWSHMAQVLPPSGGGGRRTITAVQISAAILASYSHIVIKLARTNHKVSVHVDVVSDVERSMVSRIPTLTSLRSFLGSHTLLSTTPQGALSYNITLQGLVDTWQAVRVRVSAVNSECTSGSNSGGVSALIKLHSPHAPVSYSRHYNSLVDSAEITVKLPFTAPPGDEKLNLSSNSVVLQLFLNPQCVYTVSMWTSLSEMLGQIVRLHGHLVLPTTAAIVLASLSEQLATGGDQLSCRSAVLRVTPIKLVLPAQILSEVARCLCWLPICQPSSVVMATGGWPLSSAVSLLLYLVSWSVALLTSSISWLLVSLIGALVHKSSTELLSRVCGVWEWVCESVASAFVSSPVLLSAAAVCLAASSCGALASLLATTVFCVRVFRIYENSLSDNNDSSRTVSIHVAINVTIISALVTLCGAPSLIVWAASFTESRQLVNDASFWPAMVVCVSGAVLWRDSSPLLNHGVDGARVAVLVRAASVLLLSHCLVHWYLMAWLLSGSIGVLAVHQAMTSSPFSR